MEGIGTLVGAGTAATEVGAETSFFCLADSLSSFNKNFYSVLTINRLSRFLDYTYIFYKVPTIYRQISIHFLVLQYLKFCAVYEFTMFYQSKQPTQILGLILVPSY